MQGYRNPINWISPTGFSPCTAMPMQSPLIRSSASGVSRTRSDPKRSCSPTVARKTPPLTPTSSPSTTTLGSSCIARASARLMASTNVTSDIVLSREFTPLRDIGLGQLAIEMIEHGFRPAWLRCQIAFDRRLDAFMALGGKLFLLRFAPHFLANKESPQARNRLFLPMGLDIFSRTVTCRVISGGMIAEPVGDRLDEAGALAVTGCGNCLFRRGAHRHHIVAIHLLADKPGCDGLLRKCFGSSLLS